MIQFRPISGGLPYSPNRDLAYCFPPLFKQVVKRLEQEPLPALREYLLKERVSDSDLSRACEAFVDFVATAHRDPEESIEEALRRAGWFDTKPAAQIALLTYLGQVMAGAFFAAIRDVTAKGDEARTEAKQLLSAAARARRVMSMGPLERRFYFLFRPLLRRFRRWRGLRLK